jgi:hypothetical protein
MDDVAGDSVPAAARRLQQEASMARETEIDQADRDGGRLPGGKGGVGPASDVPKRQAAASYLQASTLTADAVTRESLRRRAAGLLAPRVAG